MWGANRLIFALDPKLELDAETLVLHSGPKFLCLVVHFYKYFWFWCQTRLVSEKVYAAFWLVLEITSLKIFHSPIFLKNFKWIDKGQTYIHKYERSNLKVKMNLLLLTKSKTFLYYLKYKFSQYLIWKPWYSIFIHWKLRSKGCGSTLSLCQNLLIRAQLVHKYFVDRGQIVPRK